MSMKYLLRFLVLCVFAIPSLAEKSADLPGWYLVWQDEFNGPAVDETRWKIEDAALVKNNELQFYAPDEVYIEDGNLVLRSRKRPLGGREYTSGLAETKGRFAQTFGRFEIRAKLPRTQGIWPAHWMLPADGTWPPEIDIMESIGSQPNWIVMSLHAGEWPNVDSQSGEHIGPDYSAGFHTFALEWEPREIRWYIDGIKRFSTQDQVPDKPFYLILNTAVGGDMPGAPDETTEFPQHHLVDYVRVYAREVPGTFFLTTAARDGRVEVSPPDRENRYAADSEVVLRAHPSIGRRFSHWTGDFEGSDNPVSVVMDSHKRVTAVFGADPDAPLLLSKGKAASASSQEDHKTPPEYALDGDPRSRWSSKFSDPQWLMVDLGESCELKAFRLAWENAYAKRYRIEASEDGEDWRTVHSAQDGHGGVEELVDVSATGRYVKLTGEARATEWGYSLWEFEVYGRRKTPDAEEAEDRP